ncbi:MAG TPA: hypothetical protein VGR00_11715, partial [Thermoanaerobaculia bacterium]|nr:hypothetical protein [Thermoanaerobaculia bacterium]
VFVAAAGPKGELSEVTQKRRDFRIPKPELEKAKGSFYTYEMTVETSGPGSILSVGVLDEVAKEAGFGRLLIPEPSAEAKKAKANPPRPDLSDPFSRRTRSRFAP